MLVTPPHGIYMPIRNIARSYEDNKLWLFDNEFAMYQGYKYMYTNYSAQMYTKWFWAQEKIIKTVCIFRKQTIENIYRLVVMDSPVEYLMSYIHKKENLYQAFTDKTIIWDHAKSTFESRFHERLKFIIAWANYCKRL